MTARPFTRGGALAPVVLLPLLLLFADLLAGVSALAAGWRWQDVTRVVAVSDVHGAHGAFRRTLGAAGLLDESDHWQGGGAHLVIVGDLLDRGPDSRRSMDLLMRLEDEAEQAGGRVHVLLGNHEVMNLVGDLRYVSDEEYAAFADEEDSDQREYWFRQYLARAGADADADAIREEFDRRHPPGFFAQRRAFRPDGKYGAWLLDKSLIHVIDGTAFVHGGLAPSVAELGLAGVNRDMMQKLREYVSAVAVLTTYGLLQPGDSFYNYGRILDSMPQDVAPPRDLAEAIATVRRLNDAAIHAPNSPLWYRGTAGCNPIVESPRLSMVLGALDADRVVIGHTPTVTRGVLRRLGGRVVEIDTGMLASYYQGSGHALVIENGNLRVIDEQGESSTIDHDPRMNNLDALSAEAIEDLLGDGRATVTGRLEDGTLGVEIQSGNESIPAVFYPATERGVLTQLAAYRLDRMLGLYMVPVSVARDIDGEAGTLQLMPRGMADEAQRAESRAGASAWCPLSQQWTAMYRFDTLIHNRARSAAQILYDRVRWQLVLTGHGDAFGSNNSEPTYLRKVDVTMDAAWRDALSSLTDERLDAELADVLDRSRLDALKRRRDALLE